jgi:hypothetical protein
MPENVMSSHGPPHGYARKATDTSFVTPTPKKYKVDQEYSRKNKSLGVLAENFIQTYVNNEPGSDIVVDQAARALNVERRRIYDVVNILESIRVVRKNKVPWNSVSKACLALHALSDTNFNALLSFSRWARKRRIPTSGWASQTWIKSLENSKPKPSLTMPKTPKKT